MAPKVENPNAPNDGWAIPGCGGWTPIHVAVFKGFPEIVEFMVPLAENPFAPSPNSDGEDTPLLLLAAQEDHKDVFKVLLDIMPLKMVWDFKKNHRKLYNKFVR